MAGPVDGIIDQNLEWFNKIREQFTCILAKEEEKLPRGPFSLAQIMHSAWDSGRFWYCLSLTSTNGMYNLFNDHIRKIYYPPRLTVKTVEVISKFWSKDSDTVVRSKLLDRAEYDTKLRELFNEQNHGRPEMEINLSQ
jgi:hypothetical protein